MGKQELHCYTRVSTMSQESKGSSLDTQKELGQKISKKLGLKFIHRNEGVHSSTIKNKTRRTDGEKFHYRFELENLKDDIESGLVKNIWCQDGSRMFRDSVDTTIFRRNYLQKFKVRFFEGDSGKEIDFNDEDSSVMYDLMGRLEEHENKKRTLKSERGTLKILERESGTKSVFLGGRILFGYINIDKTWNISNEESEYVQKIFDMYEKGSTVKYIKNLLDNEGVKTRSGSLWSMGTISRMLRNKTYTGLHTVHLKRFDKTFSYKVPKIIQVGQFNRVQNILDRNLKYKDNNKKVDSLLGGLLFCECGTTVGSLIRDNKRNGEVVSVTKKYHCLNKGYIWKGKDITCTNSKSLSMEGTNKIVLELVKETVQNSNLLKENYKKTVMKQKSKSDKELNRLKKNIEDSIQYIYQQIDNIENQMVDIQIDLTLGKKEESMVKKLTQRYQEELDKYDVKRKDKEDELEQIDKDNKWLDWVSRFGKELNTNVKNKEKQREFIEGVVDKIIVHSEMDMNRSEKLVQVGHSLEVHYKMGIVDDKLDYKDDNKKSKGYEIQKGKSSSISKMNTELTLQSGRKWVKKK